MADESALDDKYKIAKLAFEEAMDCRNIDYKEAYESTLDNAVDLAQIVMQQGAILLECKTIFDDIASGAKVSTDQINAILETFREFQEEEE